MIIATLHCMNTNLAQHKPRNITSLPAPLDYPLRFSPHFRNYLWGGRRLETVLGKELPSEGVWAESWEIVDHHEHHSLVVNGPLAGISIDQLVKLAPEALFGGQEHQFPTFPLLLKYLDSQLDLSVQVHPEDDYAGRMPTPDLGKTEAWYVIAAVPDSVVYAGLKQGMTKNRFEQAIKEGNVADCLHKISPKPGDCLFIPAGTVHALGAGIMICEIQQASNATFRVFDWNRVGNDGKPRELHIEQALDVINFGAGPQHVQKPQTSSPHDGHESAELLVECPQFNMHRYCKNVEIPFKDQSKFRILTVPNGSATINWEQQSGQEEPSLLLKRGESLLIPAAVKNYMVSVNAESEVLSMSLPPA